jgi:hypothetical protein
MQLFNFFVESSRWPMMYYKVFPTDPIWSSIDVPLIRLWKANPNGSLKLHTGVPCPVPYRPNWGNNV